MRKNGRDYPRATHLTDTLTCRLHITRKRTEKTRQPGVFFIVNQIVAIEFKQNDKRLKPHLSLLKISLSVMENFNFKNSSGVEVLNALGVMMDFIAPMVRSIVRQEVEVAEERISEKIKSTIEKPYLRKKEAAALLRVNPSTLYRWDKAGILKPVTVNGTLFYKREDVENLMKVNKNREKK